MAHLEHAGVKHRSGRYEYGTGEIPYQHEPWFTWSQENKRLIDAGMKDAQIADYFHMNTQDLRSRRTVVKNEKLKADIAWASKLKQKGMSNYAIGEKLGVPESTIRNYLKPETAAKTREIDDLADQLTNKLKETGAIDIGEGMEIYFQVADTKFKAAVEKLAMNGYTVMYFNTPTGSNKKTSIKALVKLNDGETVKEGWKRINEDKSLIKMPVDVVLDRTRDEYRQVQYPESFSSSRLKIRYGDEGGTRKDGVIELRRGVEDISLGNSMYSQVRILVDGKYYMKGMAVYSDDMPDGVDIIYNSRHLSSEGLKGALKPIKNNLDEPLNPFGATLTAAGQRIYVGEDGKEHLSVINKVKEQDDWADYSKTLASQFLAKQDKTLAKQQLGIDIQRRKDTFEEIKKISNPVIRQQLLLNFAGSTDTAAEELKAAALPRQATYVLLPVPSLKENEIYAPKYKDGEEVILVRYPHGGTFEIPRLIVNNKNREARSFMQNASDAVGINGKTAEILSGADFDGDTALVIPTNGIKIKTTSPLQGLKGFDPEKEYPEREGMKVMQKGQMTQTQMGVISNLITDMTIAGADPSELARAVKHSMVVIDAAKHHYDFKKSEEENGIAQLHKKYQGKAQGGAQTLLSRAKSKAYIDEIDHNKWKIDPETGEISYIKTGRTYVKKKYLLDKNGEKVTDENGKYIRVPVLDKDKNPKVVTIQTESTKMRQIKDARNLISMHNADIENIYADYANECKALANKARLEYLKIDKTSSDYYSPTAAQVYAAEVSSLFAKLNEVGKNAPLERQAQLLKDAIVKKAQTNNVNMSKEECDKLTRRALRQMRTETGAKHQFVEVTEKEWKAMNAGALKKTALKTILSKMEGTQLNSLSMPKENYTLTAIEKSRIKLMAQNNFTYAEIADALNISASTVAKYARE